MGCLKRSPFFFERIQTLVAATFLLYKCLLKIFLATEGLQ